MLEPGTCDAFTTDVDLTSAVSSSRLVERTDSGWTVRTTQVSPVGHIGMYVTEVVHPSLGLLSKFYWSSL